MVGLSESRALASSTCGREAKRVAANATSPRDDQASDAGVVGGQRDVPVVTPTERAGQKRGLGSRAVSRLADDNSPDEKKQRVAEDPEDLEAARRVHVRPSLAADGDAALSPLSAASAEQIRQHLRDVRREVFLRPLVAVVTRLMFHRANHGLFNARVDPVVWNIPHYLEIVKHPMDLALVKSKCLNLEYATVDECAADVRLVFANARLFNPPGHVVHEAAKELLREFEGELARFHARSEALKKRRDEHSCPFCLANVCTICSEKCITFEPPFVHCAGPCRQRIKRHAVYFKTPNRSHHWCAKCYTALPKVITLPATPAAPTAADQEGAQQATEPSAGTTVAKQSLLKAKFLDELTEPWVQCDKCSNWVHQVCALFNAYENDDNPYTCPLCRLKELDEEKENWDSSMSPSETSVDEFPLAVLPEKFDLVRSHSPVLKRKPIAKDFTRVLGFDSTINKRIFGYCDGDDIESGKAANVHGGVVKSRDLVSCPLSRYMQDWIHDYLVNAGEVEAAQSVVIKVASSIRASCVVSPVVRQHFRSGNLEYPEEIDYTSKAIFVFQTINGIEVCIFSMYVQEYDGQCAFESNRNRTYIAYIDSLVYMRPRHVRTNLFHQILISYLAFCKGRGFEFAHIWACPTTRGGDFIYWCHPTFQKNPGKDRLLQWYLSMAAKGKQSGVVFDCKDLFSCEFEHVEATLDKRLPPYFEGDYWPTEVERLAAFPPKRGRLSKEAYAESLRGQKFRKRLVDSVKASRDSLFVIALQPSCTSCRNLIVNAPCGKLATAGNETPAYLCEDCQRNSEHRAEVEQSSSAVTTRPVAGDALEDRDLSCAFLDHRPDLLKNCEERHYQFDSYRRAKYSTMMVLYQIQSSQRLRQ